MMEPHGNLTMVGFLLGALVGWAVGFFDGALVGAWNEGSLVFMCF
jgi:hypothetical protein